MKGSPRLSSGSWALTAQASVNVLPVLIPPWNVSPFIARTLVFTSTPCHRWVMSP